MKIWRVQGLNHSKKFLMSTSRQVWIGLSGRLHCQLICATFMLPVSTKASHTYFFTVSWHKYGACDWVEKLIHSHNSCLWLVSPFLTAHCGRCEGVRHNLLQCYQDICVHLHYRKDESKEPIVEVRTEDECTANHNEAGPTEPNETTPLTEPEWVKINIQHTAFLPLKSF